MVAYYIFTIFLALIGAFILSYVTRIDCTSLRLVLSTVFMIYVIISISYFTPTINHDTIIKEYTNSHNLFYEYPAHMLLRGELQVENPYDDYRLVELERLSLTSGDVIFSPSLGTLTISSINDTEIRVADFNSGRVYSGMSGERVLSIDFKYTIGFISRIEARQLVIVRTQISY